MSSLSQNPYDQDHATLTPKEQSEAWWRGSSDRFVKPFTEYVRFTSCNHLMAGYNSRKLDEATWAKIAFHLAAGVPIIKIAEHYKLSRSTIWRALGRSHNLRRRVAEESALMRREADSRFVAMRELVVDTLYRAVADGNMRATLWAADRLGLRVELLQQAEKPPKPGASPSNARCGRRSGRNLMNPAPPGGWNAAHTGSTAAPPRAC
ncbi:helix-turn-helix domain-containing protein [Niveispirillum sp. KHB5.9]|uniref:helix-turn-helix domain-containing protein n=1 Tax=Niveispirillum sp. KHB5.9 TaxID=3400269 RepID=UPI003A8BFA17